MKRTLTLGVVLFSLLTPLALRGDESKREKSKLDLTQPYLLLATTLTSTMQKELSEASAAGYRVLAGCRTGGGEFAMLLEKVPQPPEFYQYLLLATTRTSTMQMELDEAAAQGFLLLRRAMMGSGSETMMVLEKAPGPRPSPSQYLLLATSLTGTLQKELGQAADQGYEVVGMVRGEQATGGGSGQHIVILEKSAQPPDEPLARAVEGSKPDPQGRYLLLATERTSTMQKELDKAASTGHRILVGSPTSGTELMVLLEKVAQPNTYQYQLLATKRLSTLQKELNQAAGKGFRLLPQTVVGKRGTGGGWKLKLLVPTGGMAVPDETVAVVEKAPGSEERYQYIVLDTQRTSTMQKEISQGVRDGYGVIAMSGSPEKANEDSVGVAANLIVVLEKSLTQ